MHPKFVSNINTRAILFKRRRWVICSENLGQINKQWVKIFVISSFISALLIISISVIHGGYKFIKDGDPIYGSERVGAVCWDGRKSSATGSGACSHHGGVKYWRYKRAGTHHFNLNSYLITIGISLSFISILSIINKSSRLIFVSVLYELAYIICFILYSILFGIVIILKSPYLIYKYKSRENTQKEPRQSYGDDENNFPEDDLPF